MPYEYYRWLRDNDPVSTTTTRTYPSGYWAVTRYEDVQRVSRDAATFRNAPDPFLDDGRMAPGDDGGGNTELLISKDAPDHIKLRKLINKGFTPRRVADLADRLRERTDAIIDGLADRDGCDLVHDLALWLPLHVIADMVGRARGGPPAGLRLDRADLRLRPRRHRRAAGPGHDRDVHVRRRAGVRARDRAPATTS